MMTRAIPAVFLATLLLAVPASADVDVSDPVPAARQQADDIETHAFERGKSVVFGKSKNKILGYAAVTTKTGTWTTDHQTGKQYEEDITRYKLSLNLQAKDASTASLEGKVKETTQYTETSSAFDVLVELQTGIEGSTTNLLHDSKTLSATIVTSLNATAQWQLRLDTEVDTTNATSQRQGSLQSADRRIDIIDDRFAAGGPRPVFGFGIEFFEDGKWLGGVGDGAYLFRRGLDPELKLVLVAAMEAVNFRHLQ